MGLYSLGKIHKNIMIHHNTLGGRVHYDMRVNLSGRYNFFHFQSALIWDSKFSFTMRYLRVNILTILSCNVLLSPQIEGELKFFEGKVVLRKVMIMSNQAEAQFRSCVTAQV